MEPVGLCELQPAIRTIIRLGTGNQAPTGGADLSDFVLRYDLSGTNSPMSEISDVTFSS